MFVEFLGDLVKLHLLAGSERMLAKVGAEHYPASARPRGGADPDLLEGRRCPAPRRLSRSETTPPGSRSTRSTRSRRSSSSGRLAGRGGARRRSRRRSRQRLGDGRPGGAGDDLDRLLPGRAARDHRPRQLLDVDGRRVRQDVHDRELQRAVQRPHLLGQHALHGRDLRHRRGRLPRPRVPRCVLPRPQGAEPAHPDRALHHRARARSGRASSPARSRGPSR